MHFADDSSSRAITMDQVLNPSEPGVQLLDEVQGHVVSSRVTRAVLGRADWDSKKVRRRFIRS
jgi:hypothetical protein